MIPDILLPSPTKEEAELFAAFGPDKLWQCLDGYLERTFDTTVALLGNPTNERDYDMALKGVKIAVEHIAKLPEISTKILNPQKEEEE